jgi:hypothetical protein
MNCAGAAIWKTGTYPKNIRDFIERHAGNSEQLTLRLA